MLTTFICKTCGTQYPAARTAPERCHICEDDRQYVPEAGQAWLSAVELKANHRNVIELEEPDLWGIGVTPKVGIGQRALLVQSESGNVLWDCVPLLDDTTKAQIDRLGGLAAIAISHPHFYTSMVDWSDAFGGVPIYIHAHDRAWVSRQSPNIQFWEGAAQALLPGVTLINCGGHFPGSCVLHWQMGAGGRGALLTGDTLYVVSDRRYVSFMYSFPNLIPLPAHAVQQIVGRLDAYAYDRLYAGWFGAVLKENAEENVAYSAARYVKAMQPGAESG